MPNFTRVEKCGLAYVESLVGINGERHLEGGPCSKRNAGTFHLGSSLPGRRLSALGCPGLTDHLVKPDS